MKKYFAQARDAIHQNMLGADGYSDWNAAGPWDRQNLGATGAEDDVTSVNQNAVTQKSRPFIILVRNTTTATLSNVVILDSALKASESANAYGNNAGIYIEYSLTNMTYLQFLASINNGNIFRVGKLRIQASASSDSNALAQPLKTLTIRQTDQTGTIVDIPITPEKDMYQNQNYITEVKDQFMVNSLTKLTISQVLANTDVTFSFYPMTRVNSYNQLEGGTGVVNKSNPNLNQLIDR